VAAPGFARAIDERMFKPRDVSPVQCIPAGNEGVSPVPEVLLAIVRFDTLADFLGLADVHGW
jgi:hypothetical protein